MTVEYVSWLIMNGDISENYLISEKQKERRLWLLILI